MKNLKLLLVAIVLIASAKSFGQVAVNVNIGTPPKWAPVGNDNVQYYYLPDVESYYDVKASRFIYFNDGKWVHNRFLPGPYRNYNLYNGYKVVLHDYHGNTPYTHFNDDRKHYYKGYKGAPQKNRGFRGQGRSKGGHGNGGHENGHGNGKGHGGGHGNGHK